MAVPGLFYREAPPATAADLTMAMATTRDYYEVLNVDRQAGPDDIKRSYRKMAMKYHPDRNPGDAEAEQQFKDAAEAYEVLSNPEKRQRYDRFGHEGLRGTSGHDFSHMDAGDIFSMFEDIFGDAFGGRRRGRRGGQAGPGAGPGRGARRGYDLETEVEISLEEAAAGLERDIEFTRQDLCETCNGQGHKPGSKPVACVTCGGQGQVAQSGLGGMFRMVTTCPGCNGAGKVYKDKCSKCGGTGRQPKKRVIVVKIPAGIHDGQAIRVGGEGEPGTGGGPRGDLHVVVRVAEHKLFVREDDHLILRMPIGFSQAALGGDVEVPTLNGTHSVTIKPGTQHGEVLRIGGQGMPNLRSGRKGDLAVLVLIEIPKKLTEKQKELLREFARTEDHKMMPESHGFWDRIKEYLGAS